MNKPEVMLLGTFHMSMDPAKVNDQQEEIRQIVQSLKEYQPTKIAVEKSFLIEEELDRKYREYQQGQLIPAYDEVEQFAFRLAHEMGLPEVHPVDEIVDMSTPSLNQVFEWAKEHQPKLFQEILDVQKRLKGKEKNHSVKDILHYINDPEYIKEMQRIYMKLTRVGDRQHQIGVQWIKQWHHRDLAIAANIARITNQQDRVLVMIGGDHLHLLRQFLEGSGDYFLPHIHPYLPQ